VFGGRSQLVENKWSREDVEKTLKAILVDALGVEEEEIVPEASLVQDLGVESIDFLDIGFRVQQSFGVELPNRALQEKVLNWRNLKELTALLEKRYGVQVTADELKSFRTMGIADVVDWISRNRGIAMENGEAEKMAADLVERLVRDIESVGFKATLIDREEIKSLLLQNLSSPKVIEAMLRLFSVSSLVDFITAGVQAANSE